jgi:uncharacterized membrane protein
MPVLYMQMLCLQLANAAALAAPPDHEQHKQLLQLAMQLYFQSSGFCCADALYVLVCARHNS